MEIACNNQSEQFELLSNKSLDECLIKALNDDKNSYTNDRQSCHDWGDGSCYDSCHGGCNGWRP